MNRQAARFRIATILLSLAMMCGVSWTTPSIAGTEPTQPTLRELVQKRPQADRPADQIEVETLRGDIPDDPLDRGLPRSSVRGFLTAAGNRNYAKAAEYLDLRNLPAETIQSQGPELARQLKIILDRTLWIDLDALSATPAGDQADDLHPARDRVGRISGRDQTFDIFLQRIPREDGLYIWKFAGVTVADIPKLYEEFGYGSLEQVLPPWMFDVSLLGINLWLWMLVIVLGAALYPVAVLITRFAIYILRRFNTELADNVARFFSTPLHLVIWAVLGRYVMELVGPSVALRAVGDARTVLVFALAWLLLRAVDFVAHRTSANLDRRGLGGTLVLLKPLARLLKAVAITAALLLWLDNIGFKVTTLLAGLSISGVAVALASQKSLENIFGAVTLFTGQPVRVGDFCRFGDKMGTVEEIGLRATRIRTLERSVITIANAEFSNMHLDNLSRRDRFWYHPRLSLRYETTPDQIRYILVETRRMLYAHPKVLSEPLHVRFSGFGEYSLDLDVFAYIDVTDHTESLEIAEDLNLRVMEIIAAAGSDFAFPAQIQYELPGKPFDDQRAQAVAAQVRDWKSNQALYLPNFPKEKIAEVKGSLDYPPEGSPLYAQARG